MNTNRPIIKVPLETLDIIVEMLAVSILILLFVFTITEYSHVSENIPIHYGVNGNADSYGDKSNLFLLPVLGLGLSVLMYILSKYPHLHNYLVDINKENALKNYRFSSRILRFTSLGIALLFATIQYTTIQIGKGNDINLSSWFLPTIIGLGILVPIGIFIHQYKMNKK